MKKFDNFSSNLNVLKCAEKENLENEFIISGIIDKFILQFDLCWKVLKLCLKYEGKFISSPSKYDTLFGRFLPATAYFPIPCFEAPQ